LCHSLKLPAVLACQDGSLWGTGNADHAIAQRQPANPDDIELLSVAFNLALHQLHLVDRNDPLCDIVARKVIEIGTDGTRAVLSSGWPPRTRAPTLGTRINTARWGFEEDKRWIASANGRTFEKQIGLSLTRKCGS
jgi:hypothetical protein